MSNQASYLLGLNPAQLRAVRTISGPVLVLAAAGTGKTKTLTARVAHILKTAAAYPNEILVVTFTNKAASEMSERIYSSIPEKIEWLGTFHAAAAKILRAHAEKVRLKSGFSILDYGDQLSLLKNITSEEFPDLKEKCKLILEKIQKWKDSGNLPHDVKPVNSYKERDYLEIYKKYQARMLALNCCDFGDLMLFNVVIFSQYPEVAEYYRQKFRYIMIDEYQDTNAIQCSWVTTLAGFYKNICVVGDDDQSIYSWRGAEVKNILSFPQDFPGTEIIKLERNYRSTRQILAVASSVITNNAFRLTKDLWTEENEGSKVKVVKLHDSKEEAHFISHKIREMKLLGSISAKKPCAILVRATFQMIILEEYMMKYSIPYKIIGGVKFYAREEIKDILSYLRLIVNNDDFLAFDRIINKPRRGIGAVTMKKIYTASTADSISPFIAMENLLYSGVLPKAASEKLKRFIEILRSWSLKCENFKPHEVIEKIVYDFDYMSFISTNSDFNSKFENIYELISVASKFEDLAQFVEHTTMNSSTDTQSDANEVNIMTLHGSKGLEFSCVFLPGWEERLFPHQKTWSNTSNISELEEERRLAYVGITRARDELFITRAGRRAMNNSWQNTEDSRFLREVLRERDVVEEI